MKKLQLKKEVVAKLNKEEMMQAMGGQIETIIGSCGARCNSAYIDCVALPFPDQPSNWLCGSFANGPTCGGTICGSDLGCVPGTTGGNSGNYSFDICTTISDEVTQDWHCSICIC